MLWRGRQRDFETRCRCVISSSKSIFIIERKALEKIVNLDDQWEYWQLADAVIFCFTVITTIGYGNVAPATTEGRLFVIFYGLIGVPFTMLVIANLGKFLAELLKRWTRPFVICFQYAPWSFENFRHIHQKCFKSRRVRQKLVTSENSKLPHGELEAEMSQDEADMHQGALSLFIAFILYIIVGSFIIASYEPEMDVFKVVLLVYQKQVLGHLFQFCNVDNYWIRWSHSTKVAMIQLHSLN